MYNICNIVNALIRLRASCTLMREADFFTTMLHCDMLMVRQSAMTHASLYFENYILLFIF